MIEYIALISTLYLILGVVEFQFPVQRGQSLRGRARNIFFTGIFMLTGAIFTATLYSALPLDIRKLPDRGALFSLLVAFEYLFIFDFIFYWYHRAEHGIAALWPIHELHHSDTEMNATTSLRTYWLERPLQSILILTPMHFLVGIDTRAIVFFPIILTTWLFFTHANWKLRLGFFTPLLCGPQLHRIHHSILPEHQNKNFAQFFPCIDLLFGTFYTPERDEFPPTGTLTLDSNASIKTFMIRPFESWADLLRK